MVTLVLQDQSGVTIGTITLPAEDLAVGAETTVTVANAPPLTWNTFTSRTDLAGR